MAKKKKMTYDVAAKVVSETFLGEIHACGDVTELKSKVVAAQRSLRQIIDTENDDAQLTAARELVSDLSGGYKEAAKNEQAKIVVCLQRLEELGDA